MGLRAELKSVDVTSPIMARRAVVLVVLLVCASLLPALADKGAKKKKSISDYSDVDVERIFQEWEVRDHLPRGSHLRTACGSVCDRDQNCKRSKGYFRQIKRS